MKANTQRESWSRSPTTPFQVAETKRRTAIVRAARILMKEGRTQGSVARALGVTAGSLSRYLSIARLGGMGALCPKTTNAGRRPRAAVADRGDLLGRLPASIREDITARVPNARVGKIARLPFAIREELNRRLLDGDSHRVLLVWLNSKPTVRQRMKSYFGENKISANNLSAWVKGGFQDYLQRRGLRQVAVKE